MSSLSYGIRSVLSKFSYLKTGYSTNTALTNYSYSYYNSSVSLNAAAGMATTALVVIILIPLIIACIIIGCCCYSSYKAKKATEQTVQDVTA